MQIGKKEIKLSLLLYIENSKDTTRKLLELISESGKVAGYKINIQKSVAFLHTNDELSENENKETISLTIPSERIKHLGINLRIIQRKVQTLMKETEDDKNRWKDILCSWTGRINTVKMIILPNAIYR